VDSTTKHDTESRASHHLWRRASAVAFHASGALLYALAALAAAAYLAFMIVWGVGGCEYDVDAGLAVEQQIVLRIFLGVAAVPLLWSGLSRLLNRRALPWLCVAMVTITLGVVGAVSLPFFFPECV
jgi:hypothetical protein